MPIEFEDTISGSTDISGSPPPERARSPQSVAGDTRKAVNQKQRGPQPDSGGQSKNSNPLSGAADAVGGAVDSAGQWLEGQGFAVPKKTSNPIDWLSEYEADASVPWGWARQAYKTISGTYHDGVNGLFAGDDAQSRVLQTGANFLADAIPLVGLQQAAGDVMGDAQAIASGDTSQASLQKRRQQGSEEAVQGAPGAAIADASMILPGSVAGRAAGVALPLLESLLGGDPDEQSGALAWAAAGTVLSFAHLPEPVRKVLLDRFGDWPGVEKALTAAVDGKKAADRSLMDPTKRNKVTADWITEQMKGGAMSERLSPLPRGAGRAAKPGEAQRVAAEVTPEGAIKLLPSESRAAVQKMLKKIGAADSDELVTKALGEGITDPKLVKSIIAHWKDLGQTYDLQRYHPEEMPLRDPRRHLDDLPDQAAGTQHVQAINRYLDQIHRGLGANASNPMQAILRSLAGHSRATQLTHQQWQDSLLRLIGDKALSEDAQAAMMRASEGDEEAYAALPIEQQLVIDGWGLMRAAARETSQGTDYAHNFLPNWTPRTDKEVGDMIRGRGRPSSASVMAREARLHREEAIQAGPEGQLVLGPRFKSVAEANKALGQSRSALIDTLMGTGKLSAELLNDPEARAIRELSATDPEGALARARTMAAQKYPDKEANWLRNVNRVFANQVSAIATHQALQEFTHMLAKDGKAAAIKLIPGAQRQREQFLRRTADGRKYEQLAGNRFAGYVFHPDLAKDLGRYVNHVQGGLRDAAGWKQALALEGKAVSAIMFSPMVHGLNVAGRMGIGWLMNPLEMTGYLMRGKAIRPQEWDDTAWELRNEFYNAGGVPHFRGKSYADNALSSLQDALGDVEDQLPQKTRSNTLASRMSSMWDQVARPHRWVNQHFWGAVNDFGVMMYHLEKTSALRGGLDEAAAREWAGRRANSWMGVVAPEDTNPMLHDLSRLVLFAPNWWRTWAELMVPIYKRAGFTADPAYRRFAATQSAKTIMAALAFQKLTGNALNYLASGHFQNQNQPGNQDKIEATAPWLDHMPGFSGVPAEDPKTGARRTMENPFARQQQATELAAGFQSGHSDYQSEDLTDGLAKFLISRASPLIQGTAGMWNLDLYQSVADHQMRGETQDPALQPSPASLIYGALQMTPFGSGFAQTVQKNAAQENATTPDSVLGTRIPGSLMAAVQDIGDPAGRALFSAITGVNEPYDAAQRSRGIKPSDQNYQQASQLTADYRKQMTVLSAEALSGQMTPSQWREAYVDLSRKHSAQMEALFKNSPDYVNGGQGMASQWDDLYQQATKADGTLDQDQLSQLQARFRSEHTADQMQQMNQILHQNDTRFPMLALYHKTQQQFDDWQQGWAVQHNVDINQLRREASEYGAVYGDSRAQQQYLHQHPELRRYESDKKRQFDKTVPGMVHALMYGNNATVARYLRAHHLTAGEFVEEQSQEAQAG